MLRRPLVPLNLLLEIPALRDPFVAPSPSLTTDADGLRRQKAGPFSSIRLLRPLALFELRDLPLRSVQGLQRLSDRFEALGHGFHLGV